MHGNQWVLKIAVLKYYSVSKRGTTAKSNPKQATDPISLHTKFGDNSSNTFPLNERKPCVTPDIGRRTPDIGHRTAKKAKIIYPPPRGVDIIILLQDVYKIANLISKLNFYKLIPYPMDNCFTGRRDRSRQTPEKDVLYIILAGPVSSVHSLGGASYLLPVQTE